jgi:ABC-type nitrate/sulfonate/bicarbonate transport system substrate-binding protein
MHNNELDMAAGSAAAIVLGYLQGLETMIIGSNENILDSLVFARPALERLEELQGRTIGVSRLKSLSDVATRLALHRVGLEPDADVSIRATGGLAESLAAMETGAIDAATLGMPIAFEAHKRGYRELLNITNLRIPYLGSSIGSTKRVIADQPDTIDRVFRAVALATSRLKTDREFAIQIIGKYNNVDDRDLLGATIDYYRPVYVPDLYPDPEAVQAVLDLEENAQARTTRASEVTDYRFAERLRSSGFVDSLPQ